jgi:hypothetical protein
MIKFDFTISFRTLKCVIFHFLFHFAFDTSIIAAKRREAKLKSTTNDASISNEQSYTYDIMISYSYDDINIVQRIEEFLSKTGFRVWYNREPSSEQSKSIELQ